MRHRHLRSVLPAGWRGRLPACLVAFGCASDETMEVPVEPPETWHVGVYMAADNNLDAAASGDLREMLEARVPGGVEVTVFVDRAEVGAYPRQDVPSLPEFGGAKILRLGDGEFEELEDLGEVRSLDLERVHAFVDRVANSDFDRKALVFWNHGSTSRYGSDETDAQRSIGLEDLRRAFQVDPDDASRGTHRVDVLGFDTCLMGSLGALEALGPLADVYIASAELEPGPGWNYRGLLSDLADEELDAQRFGEHAVRTFEAYYTTNPARAGEIRVTLAAWDTTLDRVDDEIVAMTDVARRLSEQGQAADVYRAVTRAITGAPAYNTDPSRPPRVLDFGGLLAGIEASPEVDALGEAAGRVDAALRRSRIAFGGHPDVLDGLGLSIDNDVGTPQMGARGFLDDNAAEDAPGRVELAEADLDPPRVELAPAGSSESPGISFALVRLSASDDTVLDAVRLSLAERLEDDTFLVFGSYRVDDAVGETTFGPEAFGLPVGTLALVEGDETPVDDDLALLLLDEGVFRLAVSYELSSGAHAGFVVLDEGLQPTSAIVTRDADDTTAVLSWEELLGDPAARIAPDLGVYDPAAVGLVRRSGTLRPVADIRVVPATLDARSGLVVAGSARDPAERVTVETIPIPSE